MRGRVPRGPSDRPPPSTLQPGGGHGATAAVTAENCERASEDGDGAVFPNGRKPDRRPTKDASSARGAPRLALTNSSVRRRKNQLNKSRTGDAMTTTTHSDDPARRTDGRTEGRVIVLMRTTAALLMCVRNASCCCCCCS